jgi:hypothetical protein
LDSGFEFQENQFLEIFAGRRFCSIAGLVGLSKLFEFMLIDPNRVIFRPAPFAGSPIAAMTARRRDRSARRPTGRRNPPTPVQLAVPPSAMPPVPPRE